MATLLHLLNLRTKNKGNKQSETITTQATTSTKCSTKTNHKRVQIQYKATIMNSNGTRTRTTKPNQKPFYTCLALTKYPSMALHDIN